MNTMIQHFQLIIRMNDCGLKSDFIKEFPLKDIIECCKRIEESDLKKFDYSWYYWIQEELIRDKNIIKTIQLAFKGKYNMRNFQNLLVDIKNHNEKMSDYEYRNIIRVLNNTNLNTKAYYCFLKYYINEKYETRKRIVKNLNHFYSQEDVKFEELTECERKLIKVSCLDNKNLIPKTNIKNIYELLTQNKDLMDFIEFLNIKRLYIPLDLEEYQKINMQARRITTYIKDIYSKIRDNEIMYRILLNWIENDCSLYDLMVINKKIENIEITKLENMVQNRISYINFIYGSKLKKFPLDSLYGRKEELIIYAIRENKNNFLKLIENNMEEFLSIPSDSILYYDKFYSVYVNLNDMTLKNLYELKKMGYNSSYSKLDRLKNQTFTFQEISTLYRVNEKYIDLYNELLDLKIDQRMIIIRQLLKKDLLDIDISELEIKKLAIRLKEKALYTWLENDFYKIKDIEASDVVKILIYYEKIKKFINEITNRNELSYILRNLNNIEKYNSIQEIKSNIENIDEYWMKLKETMKLSNDFINKYKNNINDFLLNNGAELAYEYYSNRNMKEKEAFKLIIKAVIMGEFKKLKYHTNDLEKEIDYKLEEHQVKEWSEVNLEIKEGKYNIKEYDDFYHTMILGQYPKRTCLNYKDGGYSSCLLACFDSNKKILYAKINNKIVARAMVRLTKGSYTGGKNKLQSLSFIDVEKENEENEKSEKLTLFLEKPYISGINEKEEEEIEKIFIKLLKEKAKKMGALLVLSNNYYKMIDKEFISMSYYIYISKSKSSSQYLDSLSGEATVSDVGEYKINNFFVWSPKKEEITFESIFK